MIQAIQLDMSITIGDLLVSGGSVLTITICYLAMKATLESIATTLRQLTDRCNEHDDTLKDHGEGIAALDAAVFGRRRHDSTKADRSRRLTAKEEGA